MTTDTNSFSCHGSPPAHLSQPKVSINEAFKDGIDYFPADSLVEMGGEDWKYQPHPNLYEILARGVLDHYDNYKREKIDKTSMPTYFYVGRPGTGRSRNASEFSNSVNCAIESYVLHPLHYEFTQRLKTSFVFHVSFEGMTALEVEELSNPMNAIGARMLRQLLDLPLAYIRSLYVTEPIDVFQLVAAAAKVDLYNDFVGILVIDGFQDALSKLAKNEDCFYELLTQIGLSLISPRPVNTKGTTLRKVPFIITCVTATRIDPRPDYSFNAHRKRVYLPLNQLSLPCWKSSDDPIVRNSSIARRLAKDVGGHPKAMKLLADELNKYEDGLPPNEDEDKVSTAIHTRLDERYRESVERCKDQLNYENYGRITLVGI
jgi:hypothetical protein